MVIMVYINMILPEKGEQQNSQEEMWIPLPVWDLKGKESLPETTES